MVSTGWPLASLVTRGVISTGTPGGTSIVSRSVGSGILVLRISVDGGRAQFGAQFSNVQASPTVSPVSADLARSLYLPERRRVELEIVLCFGPRGLKS